MRTAKTKIKKRSALGKTPLRIWADLLPSPLYFLPSPLYSGEGGGGEGVSVFAEAPELTGFIIPEPPRPKSASDAARRENVKGAGNFILHLEI
jgi:hypothetical protein